MKTATGIVLAIIAGFLFVAGSQLVSAQEQQQRFFLYNKQMPCADAQTIAQMHIVEGMFPIAAADNINEQDPLKSVIIMYNEQTGKVYIEATDATGNVRCNLFSGNNFTILTQ